MKKALLFIFLLVTICFSKLHGQCVASYTTSQNFCQNDSVIFSFTGIGTAISWDFGDTFSGVFNQDTNRIIQHRFSDTGTFRVTLIANNSGCADTQIFSITIFKKPILSFTATDVCFNLNTKFANTSIIDPKDSFINFFWNFGDGNSSVQQNPTHLYTSVGNKNILLKIVTQQGCQDSLLKTIKIKTEVTYSAGVDSICQADKLIFTSNYGSDIPVKWNWVFGDGNNSVLSAPEYSYSQFGEKNYSLTVSFSDSSTCLLNYDSLYIRKLPDAGFLILTDTLQCFKGNSTCIKFNANAAQIAFRNILWDNGATSIVSLTDTSYCYSYNNADGGNYLITHEVIDIHGCATRVKDSAKIVVLKDPEAYFSLTYSGGCFKTDLDVKNISNMPPPLVKKFIWNFGDGTVDSANWNNLNHTYISDGNFNVMLYIQDTFGCYDSFRNFNSITNINYPIDAKLDSVLNKCRVQNNFRFKQTQVPNLTIMWFFGDGDSSNVFNALKHYDYIGSYLPTVRLSKFGCDSFVKLDTAIVYGPWSLASVTNQYQCQIKDTVYYQNVSQMHRNKHIQTFWRNIDANATDCTIDSKNGINTDSNCNNSVDSLYYKHWFTKGQERCYYTWLIQKDTIVGCSDSLRIPVPLMAPNAKLGLPVYYNGNNACLGPEYSKEVSIGLQTSLPNCGRQNYYVMWDSLCAEKSGNFHANWQLNTYRHNYDYNNLPCDSNGYATIGLIIQNGRDTLGNLCSDTGFYHHIIRFGLLNPAGITTYKKDSLYCANTTFDFHLKDTTQDSLSLIQWNFGDGTIDTAQSTDVLQHTYAKAGDYLVTTFLRHVNGCAGIDTFSVKVGVNKRFSFPKNEMCLGDSVIIHNQSNYWLANEPGYFSRMDRDTSGKETTRWDMGDGNGFSKSGRSIYLSYANIGNYTVKMEVTDSLGCIDTLYIPQLARAFSIKSQISIPADTFVCPQVIQLFSSSTVYDSINNWGHTDDSVKRFVWTFSDNSGASIEPSPSKFYAKGLNVIKLLATNTRGCKDSILDSFYIVSPTAQFSILAGDSGCQPIEVVFKNESKNANSFTWQYKNAGNNIFNTSTAANAVFTYAQYGTFYPILIAKRNALNNGIPITCADTFPLVNQGDTLRKIVVFEKPVVQFTHVTNCQTYTTTFTNTTVIYTDTAISYLWKFGDGTSSSLKNPVHSFADSGTYRIVLIIQVSKGCIDSIVKNIIISPQPIVNFSFKEYCSGIATPFTDLSNAFNDNIYIWNWNFGDGSTSAQKNPSRLYANDGNYKVFLRATNRAGCVDTITKFVDVYTNPIPQYSFLNACKGKVVVFDNTSTAKNISLGYQWTFGDGNSSNAKSPEHLYSDTGNYDVKMVATTIQGCKDSITQTVRTYSNPISNFTINNPIQCFNEQGFRFTNTSIIIKDTIKYTYWYASDGGGSLQADYNPYFSSPDSFDILLVSLTNNNCRDSMTKRVYVLPSPAANPIIDPKSICINMGPISFKDSASPLGSIISRAWNINSSYFTSDSVFNYQFNTDGNKTSRLIVAHANGCMDTTITPLVIHPKPNARILSVDAACFNGHNIFLSDSSYMNNGSSLNDKWYISTGDSSTKNQFNYQFPSADSFTVWLISESNQLCKDTAIKQIIIHPHPSVNFTIDTNKFCLRDNLFSFKNNSNITGTNLTYQWKFGDNTTSTNTNPTHPYGTHGIKTTTLIAKSTYGCLDSSKKDLEVFPMPKAIPLASDTAVCQNNQLLTFKDSSTIAYGNLKTLWVWYDNTTDTNKIAKKQFLNDSFYTHQLISTSENSCADSAYVSHTILPVPNSQFSINDSSQCINKQLFAFNNSSYAKDGSLKYVWHFGDGTMDSVLHPNHIYANDGVYKISLSSASTRACLDTAFVWVEVFPKPKAMLTVNSPEQCFNTQNFLFTGNSTIIKGSLNSFYWDTLNSEFMGNKDANLHFPIPGNYTVEYIPVSNEGCKDTTFLSVIVNPNPKSLFTINDSIQCVNNNVFQFTSTSTIAYGTMVHDWSFDQNYYGSGIIQQRIFNLTDTLMVELLNISAKGCRDSIIKPIYISPKPKANYTINDMGQCLLINNFAFTNTSTIVDGNLRYEWNFGDGTAGIDANPTHVYAKHGDFTTQLISTSNWGCKDTQKVLILVHPEPTVNFLVNDPGQCLLGNNFVTTNLSNIDSTALFYEWRWDDGTTHTSFAPSHVYAKDSNYSIKLIGTSVYGCADSAFAPITVNPMPIALFSVNNKLQCINEQNYIFTNLSTIAKGAIDFFQWNTDGKTSNNISPFNYQYINSGLPNVSLLVRSDSGCENNSMQTLRVFPKPIAAIVVNDSVQCLRGNNFVYDDVSFDSFSITQHSWIEKTTPVATTKTYTTSYNSAGIKNLQLITFSANNCKDTAQIQVRVKPMPDPNFEVLKPYYCEFEGPLTLQPNQAGGTFFGKNIVNQQYLPRQLWEDTITYVISQEGCVDSSTQYTKTLPLPNAGLGNDTTICKHETLLLTPKSWNSTYRWQDGTTEATYRAIGAGQYYVIANNICGSDTAYINVTIRDINCRFFIPTAFTPNSNGINDRYRPVVFGMDKMTYEIYNRWGEKIYIGTVDDLGWDGSYMGALSPEGYYMVVVKYEYATDTRMVKETANEVFYLLK